jgi:hypothetical protein
MSTAIAAVMSREDVKDDAIQGLVDHGFRRSQAEAAVERAPGSTFSEIYKSALEWLRQGKGVSMQTPTIATSKPNGHVPKTLRICKCGCGETVPAENRFSYIHGHLKRAARDSVKARPVVKLKKNKPEPNVEILAPPQQQDSPRVTLAVTEAQLNQFLVRLSLDEKQRLANYFLQTVEG